MNEGMGYVLAVLSHPCVDSEQEVTVVSGGAACGSDTGSALQLKEAVAGQAGYPELGGLPVLAGVPSQPPGLVA